MNSATFIRCQNRQNIRQQSLEYKQTNCAFAMYKILWDNNRLELATRSIYTEALYWLFYTYPSLWYLTDTFCHSFSACANDTSLTSSESCWVTVILNFEVRGVPKVANNETMLLKTQHLWAAHNTKMIDQRLSKENLHRTCDSRTPTTWYKDSKEILRFLLYESLSMV